MDGSESRSCHDDGHKKLELKEKGAHLEGSGLSPIILQRKKLGLFPGRPRAVAVRPKISISSSISTVLLLADECSVITNSPASDLSGEEQNIDIDREIDKTLVETAAIKIQDSVKTEVSRCAKTTIKEKKPGCKSEVNDHKDQESKLLFSNTSEQEKLIDAIESSAESVTQQNSFVNREDVRCAMETDSSIPDDGTSSPFILESPVPSGDSPATDKPEELQVCVLCNLDDQSLLFQGRLVFWNRGASEVGTESAPASALPSSTGGSNCILKKPRKRRAASIDSNNQEELNNIGSQESGSADLIQTLETHGKIWIHTNCLSWTLRDCDMKDLEAKLISARKSKCASCNRYGASLKCRGSSCTMSFHYPCAVMAQNSFLDLKTHSFICSDHIALVTELNFSSTCGGCSKNVLSAVSGGAASNDSASARLWCHQCGFHWHASCSQQSTPGTTLGWSCQKCQNCPTCLLPASEGAAKLVQCDECRKSYHIHCTRPLLTHPPKNQWRCHYCRVCTDCGSRTPGSGPSSRWHRHYTVCDSCYQQRHKGVCCPLCGKAYRQLASMRNDMGQCKFCQKYIHAECDPEAIAKGSNYVCTVCTDIRNPLTNTKLCDPVVRLQRLVVKQEDLAAATIAAVSEDSMSSLDNEIQGTMSPNEDKLTSPSTSLSLTGKPSLQGVGKPSFFTRNQRSAKTVGKLLGPGRAGRRRHLSNTSSGSTGAASSGGMRAVIAKVPGAARTSSSKLIPAVKPESSLSLDETSSSPTPSYGTGGAAAAKLTDEEATQDSKVVLFSARDEFVLSQDMCSLCGSLGKGDEGRLIACAQCGQCYHPYCAAAKITSVTIRKGWRCLDCTVCEGCGQPHDEGRLLLCDECDISYHTYCLEPKLDTVPQGNWKCKWCVVCVSCGIRDPGPGGQWYNNYTNCSSCASQTVCPVCNVHYERGDLNILCTRCKRWLHGKCDEITCEEDAERCSDLDYVCVLCRPKDELPPHLAVPEPTSTSLDGDETSSPTLSHQSDKPRGSYYMDGVCLSETGLYHIKSLIPEPVKRPRAPRRTTITTALGQLGASQRLIPSPLARRLGEESSSSLGDTFDGLDMDNLDMADIPSLLDSQTMECLDAEAKRQKRLQKLGIGGFIARPRQRALSAKDEATDEIVPPSADGSTAPADEDALKQQRRRRPRPKKKRTLEDTFPAHIQEAFFGMNLLTAPPAMRDDASLEIDSPSEDEFKELELIRQRRKQLQQQLLTSATQRKFPKPDDIDAILDLDTADDMEEDDVDLQGILPTDLPQDDDFMDFIFGDDDDDGKDTKTRSSDGDNDTGNIADAESKLTDDIASLQSTESAEQMSVFNQVSVQVQQQQAFSDQSITEKLNPALASSLPHMNTNDVEDVIKGVYSQRPDDNQAHVMAPMQQQQINHSLSQNHVVQQPQQQMFSPGHQPEAVLHQPHWSTAVQPSATPPAAVSPASSQSSSSSSGRANNILKWESDEALGHLSTISPVLYANINCPHLKQEFPHWPDRVKQITKIWRNLPTEKRQPYLQKTRDNRAASRVHKTQDQSRVVTLPKQQLPSVDQPAPQPGGSQGASWLTPNSMPPPGNQQQVMSGQQFDQNQFANRMPEPDQPQLRVLLQQQHPPNQPRQQQEWQNNISSGNLLGGTLSQESSQQPSNPQTSSLSINDQSNDDDLDDDDLLGMGNDFNILEYADADLDSSLMSSSTKGNILDTNLDDLKDKPAEKSDDINKIDVSNIKSDPSSLQQSPQGQQQRPLLLQEQPLLLQDLVEQEKQEQQQKQVASSIPSLLSESDFERLKAEVLCGQDDALTSAHPSSPQQSMIPQQAQQQRMRMPIWQQIPRQQHPPQMAPQIGMPQQPVQMQQQQHMQPQVPQPLHQQQLLPPQVPGMYQQNPPRMMQSVGMHPALQDPSVAMHHQPQHQIPPPPPAFNIQTIPAPATPTTLDPTNEQEVQALVAYENWLQQNESLLANQKKYLEDEINKLRKVKKAIMAKQRQMIKNGTGQELNEKDSMEMARVSRDMPPLQKQLEGLRKLVRQHTQAAQDHRGKMAQRAPPAPAPVQASIPPIVQQPSPSMSPASSSTPPASSPRMVLAQYAQSPPSPRFATAHASPRIHHAFGDVVFSAPGSSPVHSPHSPRPSAQPGGVSQPQQMRSPGPIPVQQLPPPGAPRLSGPSGFPPDGQHRMMSPGAQQQRFLGPKPVSSNLMRPPPPYPDPSQRMPYGVASTDQQTQHQPMQQQTMHQSTGVPQQVVNAQPHPAQSSVQQGPSQIQQSMVTQIQQGIPLQHMQSQQVMSQQMLQQAVSQQVLQQRQHQNMQQQGMPQQLPPHSVSSQLMHQQGIPSQMQQQSAQVQQQQGIAAPLQQGGPSQMQHQGMPPQMQQSGSLQHVQQAGVGIQVQQQQQVSNQGIQSHIQQQALSAQMQQRVSPQMQQPCGVQQAQQPQRMSPQMLQPGMSPQVQQQQQVMSPQMQQQQPGVTTQLQQPRMSPQLQQPGMSTQMQHQIHPQQQQHLLLQQHVVMQQHQRSLQQGGAPNRSPMHQGVQQPSRSPMHQGPPVIQQTNTSQSPMHPMSQTPSPMHQMQQHTPNQSPLHQMQPGPSPGPMTSHPNQSPLHQQLHSPMQASPMQPSPLQNTQQPVGQRSPMHPHLSSPMHPLPPSPMTSMSQSAHAFPSPHGGDDSTSRPSSTSSIGRVTPMHELYGAQQ